MVREDLVLDPSGVYHSEDMVLFWKTPAIYSQWTPAPFTIDGVEYNNTEQWMMASKARLFNDDQCLERIMATQDPKVQKRLGREVKNFNQHVWEEKCVEIVAAGNMAKFSQDPVLKETLLATGSKTIVEASPVDRVWGIGLAPTNTKARDRAQWRGENKLGVALMMVREALREEADAEISEA